MPTPQDAVITTFLSKAGLGTEHTPTLLGFIEFLKSKGQYIEAGDLRAQFTESRKVLDKKKVPIGIEKCLVCGHEEFNVEAEI